MKATQELAQLYGQMRSDAGWTVDYGYIVQDGQNRLALITKRGKVIGSTLAVQRVAGGESEIDYLSRCAQALASAFPGWHAL